MIFNVLFSANIKTEFFVIFPRIGKDLTLDLTHTKKTWRSLV